MRELFKSLQIDLTEEQEKTFKTYFDFLLEENKKYNLTRITSYEEVLVKHFYDSLTLLTTNLFNEAKTVCDIGSGAGFPGVPLAILKENIAFTLIESQTKKITFLEKLIELLELKNIKIVNTRAEKFADNNFESFDIVTARAVSSLNILNELALPLVKIGGSFLAMKGINYKPELKEAKNGIMKLGGDIKKTLTIDLPLQMGKRTIIIIDKYKSVKGYPRSFNQIKKNPL